MQIAAFLAIIIVMCWPPSFSHAREEERPNSFSAWHKIQKLDQTHSLSTAYVFMYANPLYMKQDTKKAQEWLRIRALQFSKEDNAKLEDLLRHAKLEKPQFIKSFADAIGWAEQERQKTAEELFALSQDAYKNITQDELKERYKNAYLLLAAEKGHQKAREELARPPSDRECAEKPYTVDILICLDGPDGELSAAHSELDRMKISDCCGMVPLRDANMVEVRSRLRLQALRKNNAVNKSKLESLRHAKGINSDFIFLYEEALSWANSQKSKNANELYTLSKAHLTDIEPDYLRKEFQIVYYKLALQKGSIKASRDAILKEISFWNELVQTKFLQKNQGKVH